MTGSPKKPTGKRSFRCILGLHDYHAHATDEGVKYLVCSRCGKETFPEGMDRSHFAG